MSPRLFIGWALATVVTLVAAIVVTQIQPAAVMVGLANEPAFPALREDPNAVAKITIAKRGTSFTLLRGGDGGWIAPDSFDYRASAEKVRELVVGLADMRLVEPKTTRAERYPRLEVEDSDVAGSRSRLIRVEDAAGAVLAEVILGKRSPGFTGGRDSGIYLRRPGEDQAWLASGGAQVEDQQIEWLDKGIVDVASDTIRRIEVHRPGGEAYVVERATEDEPLRLAAPPEGRKVKAGDLGRLGSGLARLEMTGVKPEAELALPAEHSVATLATFDGVEVTATTAQLGEEHWALFQARALAPADDDSEAAKAARDKAAVINGRVAGWAYQLEASSAERLSKPLEELLEKKDGTS